MLRHPVREELTSDGKQLSDTSLEITVGVPAGAVKRDQPTSIVVVQYNLQENRALFEIQPDVQPLSDVYELYTSPGSSYVFSRSVQVSFTRPSANSKVVFLQASRVPSHWQSQNSPVYKFSILRGNEATVGSSKWNCYLLVACECLILLYCRFVKCYFLLQV